MRGDFQRTGRVDVRYGCWVLKNVIEYKRFHSMSTLREYALSVLKQVMLHAMACISYILSNLSHDHVISSLPCPPPLCTLLWSVFWKRQSSLPPLSDLSSFISPVNDIFSLKLILMPGLDQCHFSLRRLPFSCNNRVGKSSFTTWWNPESIPPGRYSTPPVLLIVEG